MDEETLNMDEDTIAQAAEVYATSIKKLTNAVALLIGKHVELVGIVFPLADNVDLITFKNKKKTLFANTLRNYKECIRLILRERKITCSRFRPSICI